MTLFFSNSFFMLLSPYGFLKSGQASKQGLDSVNPQYFDFSKLKIEGNKIILPCGTEIISKYDHVVFYDFQLPPHGEQGTKIIDLEYYKNLSVNDYATVTETETELKIILKSEEDFGGTYFDSATGKTTVWIAGIPYETEKESFILETQQN